MQDNIEDIWNQAEEILCSLRELTDDELIDCRDALMQRARLIMIMTDNFGGIKQ
jgi:hypothetical protein